MIFDDMLVIRGEAGGGTPIMAAKIITSGRYNYKSPDKKCIKLPVENDNPKVEGLTITFFPMRKSVLCVAYFLL
jgi:hypothetical protein